VLKADGGAKIRQNRYAVNSRVSKAQIGGRRLCKSLPNRVFGRPAGRATKRARRPMKAPAKPPK